MLHSSVCSMLTCLLSLYMHPRGFLFSTIQTYGVIWQTYRCHILTLLLASIETWIRYILNCINVFFFFSGYWVSLVYNHMNWILFFSAYEVPAVFHSCLWKFAQNCFLDENSWNYLLLLIIICINAIFRWGNCCWRGHIWWFW